MDPTALNLGIGEVVYWDMDSLLLSSPPQDQLDHLKEDLAQIELAPNAILDIGWYGERSGTFLVVIVVDHAWEDPIFQARTSTWRGLVGVIAAAISVWQSTEQEHST